MKNAVTAKVQGQGKKKTHTVFQVWQCPKDSTLCIMLVQKVHASILVFQILSRIHPTHIINQKLMSCFKNTCVQAK